MTTTRTPVSIYAVSDNGATGDMKGRGSLVQPALVLVHSPYSRELAELQRRDQAPRLRVSVGPPEAAEVIDGRQVYVAAHTYQVNSEADPLVAVGLERNAKFPLEPVPDMASDTALAAALRHLAYSDTYPGTPRTLSGPIDSPAVNPICLIFPAYCK